MINSRISDIKRAQKEKLLYRELSKLVLEIKQDNPQLHDISLTRTTLSPDKSLCTAFFYTSEGKEAFKEALEVLKLYKPSIRKAIGSSIKSRYTPDLRFAFDDHYEKQEHFEQLMEKIKLEGE
jgi:ribosome-binding factor A